MNKIYIAEDHPIITHGLMKALDELSDCAVIGSSADGYKALREIKAYKPHILVLDLNLPRMNGLEIAKRLKKSKSETKILIFTVSEYRRSIIEALAIGVEGYIYKMADIAHIIRAIYTLADGEQFYDAALTKDLYDDDGDDFHTPAKTVDFEAILTGREKDILRLLLGGFTSQEIADILNLSINTIYNHRRNLYSKSGAVSLPDLIRIAIENRFYANKS